jgi:hypothetical protein
LCIVPLIESVIIERLPCLKWCLELSVACGATYNGVSITVTRDVWVAVSHFICGCVSRMWHPGLNPEVL